jgi:hypothetical protein
MVVMVFVVMMIAVIPVAAENTSGRREQGAGD